jgi:hypothetical protein
MHIPERFRTHCFFCDRVLDIREKGNFQKVSGWTKSRSGGGANSIALAERTNVWSCAGCIDRLTKGTFGQALLFGDATPASEPLSGPAPTNAGYDGRMLVHVCNVCGGTAPYGVGVAMRNDELGLWYCKAHLPPPAEIPEYLLPVGNDAL